MKNLFVLTAYTDRFQATGWLGVIGAAIGVSVGFTFGSQAMLNIFLGFIVLDVITGIAASVKNGDKFSSARFREMYYKLMAYLSVLLVAACLDVVLDSFGMVVWIHMAALGWILFSEGVSILENAERILGVRLPFLNKIKKLLDVIKSNGVKK